MKKRAMLGCGILLVVMMYFGPAKAEWQQMNPLNVNGTLSARHGMLFTQVAEDKVLLFGGRETNMLSDTWLYDLSDNRWTKQNNTTIIGSLGVRVSTAAAKISNNQILMLGGIGVNVYTYLSETWLYDYSQNKWSLLTPTINGTGWNIRGYAGMAHLTDDKVLLFGGYRYNNFYYNDTWIYDLSDNTWTLKTPETVGGTLTARSNIAMAEVGDGKVIMFGGNGLQNETWLYDMESNSWTLQNPQIIGGALQGRHSMGLTNIGGDRLLMFGGSVTTGYQGQNDLWLYDLSENSWTLLGGVGQNVPPVRAYHGFAAVGTGKVVLFGGNESAYNNNYGDTWVFNVPESASSTFAATAQSGGVSLSWSQDAENTGSTFYVFKNNQRLSEAIATGTEEGGRILYSYLDTNTTSGTLIRYKLLEVKSEQGSQVFSGELVVPYCN